MRASLTAALSLGLALGLAMLVACQATPPPASEPPLAPPPQTPPALAVTALSWLTYRDEPHWGPWQVPLPLHAPLVVDTAPFSLRISLAAAVPEDYIRSQLTIAGTPPQEVGVQALPARTLLTVAFPAGEAGETLHLGLGEDFALTVQRRDGPLAQAAVGLSDHNFVVIGHLETRMAAPDRLYLGLWFSRPMERSSVEAALAAAIGRPCRRVSWRAGETIVFCEDDHVPAKIDLSPLHEGRDRLGHPVVGMLPEIIFASAP